MPSGIATAVLRDCFVRRSLLLPCLVPVRYRRRSKEPKRKPSWMPMAPSKLFKIPVHPYVAPDEKILFDELQAEYERKLDSLRKLFQRELEKKSAESQLGLELARAEEAEHERLMEENRKENEKLRLIREEAEEQRLRQKEKELLEQYEKLLSEQTEKKLEVEAVVREVKEYCHTFVTYETLEEAIEKAIDNPVNVNFSIDLKGNIEWEGVPPPGYEALVQRSRNAVNRQ